LTAEEWKGIKRLQQSALAKVVVVNSSIKTAREGGIEPDAIFFTDESWFEKNEKLVKEFKGLKFTVSRRAKASYPELMRIQNARQDKFFVGQPPLRDSRSSGHRAVSLAIMCGARIVVLLGYDMQVDPETGRSHCHNDYQNSENPKVYSNEFVPGFNGWYEDGLKVGCKIVNSTKTTALKEFPLIPLEIFLPKC
jgi:hypothetical protein